MRWVLSLILAVAVAGAWSGDASAQRKLALVIGNDIYTEVISLERAVADARAYRDVLRDERGFEVFYVENGDRATTNAMLFRFLGEIEPGDTTMVVYAGHGVQLDPNRRDTLFLLPTDIPNVDPGAAAEEAFFDANALNFAKIATWVQERGAKLRLFVLDACRNNPFTRASTGRAIGVSRGIGQITSGEGEFIFYSAGPGQLALDRLPEGDDSPNSVFTRVFLEAFKEGVYLEDIANDVQARVRELALRASFEQTPYYSDGVPGKTCLDAACGAEFASAGGGVPGTGGPSDRAIEAALEETYWRYCETKDNPAYCEAYLTQYPEGPRALLVQLRLAELEEMMRLGELPPDPGPVEGVPGLVPPDPDSTDTGDGDGEEIAALPPDEGTDAENYARELIIRRANAWVPLSETYDIGALKRFVAEFPGTDEAEKAEKRLTELREFLADGQRELNRIGYPAGPVDGIWGRRSSRALKRFEHAAGLDQDGVLTEALLTRLRAADPIPRTVTRPPDPPDNPIPRVVPTAVPDVPKVVIVEPVPEPTPVPVRPALVCDESGPAFARECN